MERPPHILRHQERVPELFRPARQLRGGLDAAIPSNTAMLLDRLATRYDPPRTDADLPYVATARADVLALWEERIAVTCTERHSHLQRLRPVCGAMDQHPLRGFAGLIYELRQRRRGIRHYVWRSRDDGKLRSLHAQNDDRVFDRDNPPEGGHPGRAFSCRCHAEPHFGQAKRVVPAQDTVVDGVPVGGSCPILVAQSARCRGVVRQRWRFTGRTRSATGRRKRLSPGAAGALGLDLTTVEGVLAAWAYIRGPTMPGSSRARTGRGRPPRSPPRPSRCMKWRTPAPWGARPREARMTLPPFRRRSRWPCRAIPKAGFPRPMADWRMGGPRSSPG